jgi:hypothetical protein
MARTKGAHTRVFHRQQVDRDRAWQTMRILRRFRLPDVVATAEIGAANARKYITALESAGYLRTVVEKQNGRKGGHAVYMLVRDTGPLAPRMQSDGCTYDPNEHRTYPGGIRQ